MVFVTPLTVWRPPSTTRYKGVSRAIKYSLLVIIVGANLLARCLIAVLSIYAFWDLPEGAYWELEWSQFVPFLG